VLPTAGPDRVAEDPIARWRHSMRAAATQSQQVPIDLRLDTYADKWKSLDRLTTACIAHTLSTLGAFPTGGNTLSAASLSVDVLIDELGILPSYRPLLDRWLQILSSRGTLLETNATGAAAAPANDLESAFAAAAEELQDVPFLLEYLRRCAEMAPAILRGKASAVDTLFRGGALDLAESIYEKWPLSRYFTGIARSVVESVSGSLPLNRELRILEVGGGIGSATSSLLPVLTERQAIYCFTDVSKFFLDQARRKYADSRALRCALLDIEKDPSSQGLEEHAFDIVIACNVLHATRDLEEAIRNVTRLLSSSGVLVLCEVTNPQLWIEFAYGLMPDWYRFNDGLRRNTPLLDRETWEKLLYAQGFENVASFPEAGSQAEILGQHCLVARMPASPFLSADSGRPAQMTEDWPAQDSAVDAAIPNQSSHRETQEFLERLHNATPTEQRAQLIEFVQKHAMRVLRQDNVESIGSRQRLMDLGIDSLMAVELRNSLSSALGLTNALPATLIFDYPNIEAIADYVASRVLILEGLSSTAGQSLQTPGNAEEGQPLQVNIEDLSDEDVEKLLLEKLGNAGN
jgi:SAM-dependent methyltransferase/acyl carrier protein